ncbi:MAG: BatD family protein [Gemmatimonadaceae bacterium]|nr:BatD family protein [Gemmatimonadaceae bacterium]
MRRRLGIWMLCVAIVLPSSLRAQRSPTAILDRVNVNGRRPIDFHAIALADSVYVGQQVTYQVAVLLSADARTRLRRNPEFLPPELRGLLAYELGTPTRVPPRRYGDAVFEAHVFQRALFPVASGVQVVPAPQLTYSLPQSSSYFSREERFVVRAESASFVVKSLPVSGRPVDFTGAVGQFSAAVRVDSLAARVGDPLILTLRVQGIGNVKLLPRPPLELGWASVVAGSERVQVDSSGALVRGAKEFDWILTPARDGRVRVPPQSYSYFDPTSETYAVAESAPVELSVEPGVLAVSDEIATSDALPLRVPTSLTKTPWWNGRSLPPVEWWGWLVFALLAPIPAAASLWRTRQRLGRASRASGDMSVDALATTSAGVRAPREAIRAVRRDFLQAIADRFGVPTEELLERSALRRLLRRAGVTAATTRDVLVLLEQLDALGFAESTADTNGSDTLRAEQSVRALMARVDQEAMARGRRVTLQGSALLVLVAACTLPMVGARLHAQSSPRRTASSTPATVFEPTQSTLELADSVAQRLHFAARDAYTRRAYLDATERFAQLARAFPTDASVLADWGTAAWSAHDTVSAVIAWQRSARLAPFASDVAGRLDLLPAGARGGVAEVAMIPVHVLGRVSLLLWIGGWLVWWWSLRQRHRLDQARWLRLGHSTWRVTAMVCVVAGGIGAIIAWRGYQSLDVSSLAVVSRPETLRVAPGTDADAMGGVTTGDVVRVEATRDMWQQVTLADGRRGWLPAARLVAMLTTAEVK